MRFKRRSGFPPTVEPEDVKGRPIVARLVEVRTVYEVESRVAEIELVEANAVLGARGMLFSIWESAGLAALFSAVPGTIFRLTYQGKIVHPADPKKSIKRWLVEEAEPEAAAPPAAPAAPSASEDAEDYVIPF